MPLVQRARLGTGLRGENAVSGARGIEVLRVRQTREARTARPRHNTKQERPCQSARPRLFRPRSSHAASSLNLM